MRPFFDRVISFVLHALITIIFVCAAIGMF